MSFVEALRENGAWACVTIDNIQTTEELEQWLDVVEATEPSIEQNDRDVDDAFSRKMRDFIGPMSFSMHKRVHTCFPHSACFGTGMEYLRSVYNVSWFYLTGDTSIDHVLWILLQHPETAISKAVDVALEFRGFMRDWPGSESRLSALVDLLERSARALALW